MAKFGRNTTWLEAQTGVRYETMRRHDGKWLPAEGADQLQKIRDLAPELTLGVIGKVARRVGTVIAMAP